MHRTNSRAGEMGSKNNVEMLCKDVAVQEKREGTECCRARNVVPEIVWLTEDEGQ